MSTEIVSPILGFVMLENIKLE